MKKFTLLLCVFVVSVMMPQVMWADVTYPYVKGNLTINVVDGTLTINSRTTAGDLATFMSSNEGDDPTVIAAMKGCSSIVLIGKFNSSDLDAIKTNGEAFKVVSVDMKDAKFPTDKSTYQMTVVTNLPTTGNDKKRYVTGATCYKGGYACTLDENLSEEEINQVNYWAPAFENLKSSISDEGYYKLYKPAYYEIKKGHYAQVTPDGVDEGNYVPTTTIPVTYNGNEKIKVEDAYYQWDDNYYWNPITSLPENATLEYCPYQSNIDNLNEKLTENNYSNGLIVAIPSEQFTYCHATNRTLVWKIDYNNPADLSLSKYFYNVKDAPTPENEQDKIVVGGVFYYYYLGEWVTEESNWQEINFTYWKETLETAIFPAGVKSSQLSSNILQGCNNITLISSGNVYALIVYGEEYPKATIYNATETEASRLKVILQEKSGLSLQNNIPYQELPEEAGFHDGKLVCEDDLNDDAKLTYINGLSGLRILDLKNASNVTKVNLAKLTNQNIEYIVLPGGETKDFVCDTTTYYKAKDELRLNNLKAVISAQSTNLVAHVVEAGYLAQARCYATGLKENRAGRPAVKGLTSVTLSGNLNANDISTHDEDKGLSGENYTITTMDLEKAYFANYNDMQFQAAGFQGQSNECVLKNIKLPITPRMTDIPKDCFRNMKSLDSLCIPFNYKHIHNGALYDSNVEHLTTTDSIGGAVIDNGKYTYTLSASLEEIGDAPSPKLNGDGKPNGTEIYVFPKENGVTEIYSLATKVPKCYREAFSFDVTFGYGGQDESKVYCRDRFFNNGEREKSFVVLRYPSEEVFNRRKKKGKPVEATYTLMEQKYTDITKDYTKQDQTGAVDANGKPLLWPSRTEMNRSHNQASVGALWNDWSKSYTGSNNSEINFDEDPVDNGNNNGRLLRENTPDRQNIDLTQGMTQYVERSESGGTYTFTPTADVQNMFQYMPYNVDNTKYKKIVIEFADTVPEGFFIHHYGDHWTYYSLKGLKKYEFALTDGTIDDFTIFNWDGYWGDGFEYVAQQDRRNIKISAAYLISDEVAAPVTMSKYKHEVTNNAGFIDEDFIDYMGWHQIVLTQAVYYEPVEKEVEEDVVTRRYEDAGWFTFCIPYDMTYSQVVKMLGVPASTDKVKNYIGDSETPEAADIMPSIRQLNSVERKKGIGKENNQVIFRLTGELADQSNHTANYLEFAEDPNTHSTTMRTLSAKDLAKANQSPEDPICLVGGRPYIIKAYKRKGETISEDNLGMYIMKRYSDEFGESSSCVNSGSDYCEQLKSYTYNDDETVKSSSDGGVTLRFAKPYENHKVQAVDGSDSKSSSLQLTFTNDEEEERPYYYTMVGQFWEQDLPDYCIYMYQGHWYRYTNADLYKYKWVPYKCVILASPEKTTVTETDKSDADAKMPVEDITTGGGFRDIRNCYFPMNNVGTFDWIPDPLKLCFYGRNDYYFDNQQHVGESSSPTRYVFTMEDDGDIVDRGDDVTTVKTIDMLDGVPQKSIRSTRVYSISGQYMGESTEGLSKGVYIVGGRKIVVD